MKKKLLSVVLALAMVLSLMPAAFAAEGEPAPAAAGTVGTADALKQAIETAQDGDVITLSSDIAVSPKYAMDKPEKPGGSAEPAMTLTADVTLDLNGHTIKWDLADYEDPWYTLCFFAVDGGKLTINGGIEGSTIDCEANRSNSYGVNIVNSGEVVVNSGTFKGAMTAFQVQTGTLTVNGGSFSLAQTISTVAPEYAKYIINAIDENYKAGTAKISVKGGRFCYNIANSPEGAGTSYVAEGYAVTQLGQYYFVKPAVAKIVHGEDTVYYSSLSKAIGAVQDGQTVTLLNDHKNYGPTVDNGKTFTLDLGTHTLTLNSRLKIKSGFVTVKNGTLAGDVEMYATDTDTAYNSFTLAADATIQTPTNGYGIMVFQKNTGANNFGTTVNVDGKIYGESSALWVLGNIHTDLATAQHPVTVNVGPTAVLKNDNPENTALQMAGSCVVTVAEGAEITAGTAVEVRAGKLTVNGGVITGTGTPTTVTPNGNGASTTGVGIAVAQHTTALPIEVVVNGGTISGYTGFYVTNPENRGNAGKVQATLNGGSFAAINGGSNAAAKDNNAEEMKLTITGGLFSSDPSDYCGVNAEGQQLTGVTNTDPATQKDYPFMIAVKEETAAVPVPAEPEVKNPAADQGTAEDKALAAGAAAALKPTDENSPTPAITGGALDAAVNTLANQNTTTEEQASEALKKENISIDGNVTITVAVQHYMDITITEAKAQAGEATKSLTLNIKPMAQKVATTANLATGEEIIIKPEAQKNVNAVKIGDPVELNVTGPVTVTIPLPTDFAPQGTTKLYIKHTADNGRTYYYTGTVENNVLTFTNPHGFSLFTISATNEAVAEVNGVGYPTLQAAVDAVENDGTIKLLKDGETATVNRTVKFTVEPNNKTYTINLGSNCTDRDTNKDIFDVVYTAPSGGSSSSSYTVNVEDSKNGTVTASPKSASKNTTVTLTVKADKGYELDELTVTDKNGKELKLTDKGNGKYTFTMPASKVDVKAAFAEIVEKPAYSDVSAGAWYADAVAYVTEKGMMEGSAGKFMPLDKLTRSQMAQVLFNLEGKKSVNYALTFGDMNGTEWYAEAVRWAASEQIVNGYDNGNFGSNDPITREQLVTILYRYAQYKGLDTATTEENLTSFADAAQVSGYAVSAMNWAVGAGVINGTDSGLAPKATATRAEVAQILMNFDRKF